MNGSGRQRGWRTRLGTWGIALPLVLPLILAGLPGARAAGSPSGGFALWPFYDERDDPVDRVHTQSGLGPLLEFERSQDATVEALAFRPVFHRRLEKPAQRLEWEVLYPLMAYSRTEQDWEFQFLQLLNLRGEGSKPETREDRFDLFPLYFSGKTGTGEEYRALVPIGGRALDRLGQDEIEFALFPLYVRLVKQGVERRYFPWPLLSVTRGENQSGFRLVPLYGEEAKTGVFQKRFVLWPLFLQQRIGLDGDNPEETLSLLPLFVLQRSRQRESTTLLWPFFTYTQDREREYEQWDLPWPLIRIARGEGRTIRRFLPFFSVEERVLRKEFLLRELRSTDLILLFPLYMRSQEEVPGSLKVRDRVLWWLYSDTREEGNDGSTRRVDAWPLFRYQRDREGGVVFQTLALLEAFLPGNDRIERSYSPLWALYTYRSNPQGEAAGSLLWNLVRHETTAEGRTFELLGPLVTYRERAGESSLSILGGLLEYQMAQATRSVRLFRGPALTWTVAPTTAAGLPGAEGGR